MRNMVVKKVVMLVVYIVFTQLSIAQINQQEAVVWEATLLVQQDSQAPSLVYAHQQAEIMFSKQSMMQLSSSLGLVKKHKIDKDKAWQMLRQALSYEITRGGLIKLKYNAIDAVPGPYVIGELAFIHNRDYRNASKKAQSQRIGKIQQLMQNQEDRVDDYRRRYFMLVERFKIKKQSDLESLSFSQKSQLDKVYADLKHAEEVVRKLSWMNTQVRVGLLDSKLVKFIGEIDLIQGADKYKLLDAEYKKGVEERKKMIENLRKNHHKNNDKAVEEFLRKVESAR